MTNEKRLAIINTIQMSTAKMGVCIENYNDAVSEKIIQMQNTLFEKQFIQNLHSIKIEFLNLGREAFEHMEVLKKIIEANPQEPEFELKPATEQEIKETTDTYFPALPLTNEDLLDDNPVEGVDYD